MSIALSVENTNTQLNNLDTNNVSDDLNTSNLAEVSNEHTSLFENVLHSTIDPISEHESKIKTHLSNINEAVKNGRSVDLSEEMRLAYHISQLSKDSTVFSKVAHFAEKFVNDTVHIQ